jgi:hypothetical protein
MSDDYPRQDQRIVLRLADGTSITGLINVTGRTVEQVVRDESDPNLLVYDVTGEDGRGFETVLVSKHQIFWIEMPASAQSPKSEAGDWKSVIFRFKNGHELAGEIDITGFDRPSDYFHAHAGHFYQVWASVLADKEPQLIFVASDHVVLRELRS